MRIRSLKPEWLTDEKMEAQDDATRLLSAGLILLADDHGRGRAAAAQIAGAVWPSHMERDPRETIRKAREGLARLSEMGFLQIYEVRGQSYFAIVNWKRHQKVDKPSKPRIPEPPETLAEPSRDPRETLAPDLRSPITDHRPPTGITDHDQARAAAAGPPDETSRPMQERALQIVDAAWVKHRGVALGVEMAPGPNVLRRAKAIVKWAQEHDPGDWEGAAQKAAEAAAQNIGDSARSAFAVFAASPGQWLTAKRPKGPAPPRRNDEFEHDDPEEFWAKVAAEEAAEREARSAAGK